MRITGGVLTGRTIRVPTGAARPTQDRVREAIFSALGYRVEDAQVLDLFAGTGALGLEAWSRGAEHVCWVESHPRIGKGLQANVQALCGRQQEVRVVFRDVWDFLHKEVTSYDLIFVDPPYVRRGESTCGERLLRLIAERDILTRDGLLVFEQAATSLLPMSKGWQTIRDKKYGDTRVLFITRETT